VTKVQNIANVVDPILYRIVKASTFLGRLGTIAMIFGWLGVATIVYCFANNWRASNAFYFAAQAGLSIGFGSLSEVNSTSRLFSCAHILVFACLLLGLVGLLIDDLFAETTPREKMRHARHVMALYHDRKFVHEDLALELSLQTSTFLPALVTCWLVVMVGAIFFLQAFTTMDVSEALEFAVAACSTGGLQGMSTESDGQVKDWAAVFCGFYVILGVPLFGVFCGRVIDMMMTERARQASLPSSIVAEAESKAVEMMLTRMKGSKDENDADYGDKSILSQELPLIHIIKECDLQTTKFVDQKEVPVVFEKHIAARHVAKSHTDAVWDPVVKGWAIDDNAQVAQFSVQLSFVEFMCTRGVEDQKFDLEYIRELMSTFESLHTVVARDTELTGVMQ